MYTINLHVNANGTIDTGLSERLRLGTTDEHQRARFQFEIDSNIEGTYHYLKLVNGNLSLLYRIYNNYLTINRSITSKEGIWLISFISSKTAISNGALSGDYAYVSEPIEAVVVKGIFKEGSESEEALMLKSLVAMDFTKIKLPDDIEQIGDYFLYDSRKTYNVTIGRNIRRIGSYAFYKGVIGLGFENDSLLNTLADNAFSNITFNGNVEELEIPSSVINWGKNVFSNSDVGDDGYCNITFGRNSKLKTLGSYAFWNVAFGRIVLPDHLETFSGNTYVIKNCEFLWCVEFPNTINSIIPASAIYGCPNLTDINLASDFNASANFSNCTSLSPNSIKNMFYALKNLSGEQSKSLTLGATNLAKVSAADKQIALNKNWTLS